MNEEVVVRYHFIGGSYYDCEYTDREMYYLSLKTFENGGLLVFDKEVINTKNVTYTEIIKERVMNIDKHY